MKTVVRPVNRRYVGLVLYIIFGLVSPWLQDENIINMSSSLPGAFYYFFSLWFISILKFHTGQVWQHTGGILRGLFLWCRNRFASPTEQEAPLPLPCIVQTDLPLDWKSLPPSLLVAVAGSRACCYLCSDCLLGLWWDNTWLALALSIHNNFSLNKLLL